MSLSFYFKEKKTDSTCLITAMSPLFELWEMRDGERETGTIARAQIEAINHSRKKKVSKMSVYILTLHLQMR